MTPEREKYLQTAAAVEQTQHGVAEALGRLIHTAYEDSGLIVTVHTRPNMPPAMADYTLIGNVRQSRDVYQHLAELEEAAKKSEERHA